MRRLARQRLSVTEARKMSYGLARNSWLAIARRISPPDAASTPLTAEARSSSNQGIATRSVSRAGSGSRDAAMEADELTGGIRLLSSERACPRPDRPVQLQTAPATEG